MDKVLLGKPFVDLELRKFSFANEARMTGIFSFFSFSFSFSLS